MALHVRPRRPRWPPGAILFAALVCIPGVNAAAVPTSEPARTLAVPVVPLHFSTPSSVFSAVAAYSVDLTTGNRSSGPAAGSPGYSPSGAVFVAPLHAWFVADAGSDALTEVDAGNFQVIRTIPVSGSPTTPAYVSQTGELFVPLTNGNVSVIGAANGTGVTMIPLSGGPLSGAVADPAGLAVYVSDPNRSTVDVLDPARLVVSASVAVDSGPAMMALTPDGARLWVACSSADRADAIATSNSTIVARTPVDRTPVQLAYVPGLDRVFAGAVNGRNVTEINGTTGAVVGRLSVARIAALAYEPTFDRLWMSAQFIPGVAVYDPRNSSWAGTVTTRDPVTSLTVEPATGHLLATSPASAALTFLSGRPPRVLAAVPTGVAPLYLGGDPSGGTLWASDAADGWLVPVNASSLERGAPSATIREPGSASSDPARGEVYVPSGGNDTLAILNALTLGWISGVPVGAGPTATLYDRATHRVYVADRGGTAVTAVDVAARSSVAVYPVGIAPTALAFDPARSLLFVANYGSANVTVVNVSSGSVVRSIPVGPDPRGIAFDAADDRLFVGSERTGTINVVNLSFPGGITNLSEASSIEGIVYDPASDHVFAADIGASVVIVWNASTLNRVARVPVPSGATPVWLDPVTGAVWVGGYTAGSITVLRTEDPVPIVTGGLVPEPANATLGSTVDLVAIAQGGVAPLTFAYAGLPAGCPSQNASTLRCLPALDGTFAVTVWANDSANHTVTATASFTVTGWRPPSLTYLSVNPADTDLGRGVNVTVGVADGAPPLTYQYSGLPPGCSSANRTSVDCIPRATGDFRVQVVVSDAQGRLARGGRSLHVAPSPEVLSVLVSPTTLEAGIPASLTAFAVNGTLPYTFSWSGLPSGCASANQSSLWCTPAAASSGNLTVRVVDGLGVATSRTSPFTVVAAPSVVRFTADRPNVTIGRMTRITAIADGGSGPLAFAYSVVPPGCSAGNVSAWSCAPRLTGTYRIGVVVTDAEGGRAIGSLILAVHPPPSVAEFTVQPNELTVGGTLQIAVATAGGTLPLTLAFGAFPAGCIGRTSATWTCHPSVGGRFNVTVTATDALGVGSNASRSLQVDPTPPSLPVSPPASSVGSLVVVAGAAVVVVVVIAVLAVRRRRTD